MKKMLALLLACVMVLSLFAGCGSTESAPTEAKQEQAAQEQKPEKKEEKKGSLIIWVEKSFSEEVDKLIDDRIQDFGAQTGVEVKAEYISAIDYMTKLNAAVEAGNVPDLTLMNPYKVVNYYPNLPFTDVTDLVNEIDAERPLFPALKEGTQIEGVNYFVPFYAASSLLFLRKDLFDAKNVPLPTTWEELWDAAVKVSDPDNGIYGLGMGCGPTDEDCENSFRMMMWDLGGKILTSDGEIVADKDPGLSQMIDQYVKLYEAGAIPPAAITWDPGGNNKSYLMGESAMVINVPTLYNALKNDEQYAELFQNTVVLNLPKGSADDAVFGNPSGWAIMKDAKNKDNAREFIKFVSEKEWYDMYMDAIAPVFAPVFQDLVDSETWSQGVNKQAIEYIQNATGYYGYPCETLEGRAIASKHYYSFPMARMLNSILTGSATKEEAMELLAQEIRDTAVLVKAN